MARVVKIKRKIKDEGLSEIFDEIDIGPALNKQIKIIESVKNYYTALTDFLSFASNYMSEELAVSTALELKRQQKLQTELQPGFDLNSPVTKDLAQDNYDTFKTHIRSITTLDVCVLVAKTYSKLFPVKKLIEIQSIDVFMYPTHFFAGFDDFNVTEIYIASEKDEKSEKLFEHLTKITEAAKIAVVSMQMSDIDPKKIVQAVSAMVDLLERDLPRCKLAFSTIKRAAESIGTDFDTHYRNFSMAGNDATEMICSFITDIARRKDEYVNDRSKTKLTAQIIEILRHLKSKIEERRSSMPKNASGKNPATNLINMIDRCLIQARSGSKIDDDDVHENFLSFFN